MSYAQATLVGLFLGPVFAVLITLWHQDRKQKRDAKERLFVTLMAYRKTAPISLEWAQALNLIDVIYARHPKVIQAWHDLYDYFHVKPMDPKQLEHKRITLLSAMAMAIGFPLEQVDIDRCYIPQAHSDEAQRNYELAVELLRVLKGTERLSVVPRQEKKDQ